MSVLGVNWADLRRAAGDVDAAAGLVRDVLGAQGGHFAVPSQPGWDSIARLGTGAPVWLDYLNSLVTALGGTASDLRTLADTMENAEQEAGRPWGGRVPE